MLIVTLLHVGLVIASVLVLLIASVIVLVIVIIPVNKSTINM